MAATLSSIDNMLKTFYLPRMRKSINLTTPLFSQLKRNREDIQGKNATVAIHSSINEGGGSRGEMGTLPDPGQQGYNVTVFPTRSTYWKMRISGQSIKASRGDAGSFARSLEHEIQGCQDGMKRDIERQLFGDQSATLAVVNGAVTSTETVVCDGGLSSTIGTSRRIRAGMVLDFWNSGLTALEAQSVKVASVTNTTTFVLNSEVTLTDDGVIVRQGTRDATDGSYEMTGIKKIVAATGALQSLNPATAGQEFWAADVNAINGNLSIPDMLQICDDIEEECGSQPNLIITTTGIRRKYFDLLDDAVRLAPRTLHGGWTVLDFAAGGRNIPILCCPDCPKNSMFWLNTDRLAFYWLDDFHWLDEDGSRLHLTANKDAWEATLAVYGELGTDSRHAHGLMSGVTE